MYWRVSVQAEEPATSTAETREADGRFVIHRHRDAWGPHLDLRLEWGDVLMGWRIDETELRDGAWATEKAPHPMRWLDSPADAVIEDAGVYAWVEQGGDRRSLRLAGLRVTQTLRLDREPGLAPSAVRGLRESLDELGVDGSAAVGLLRDGLRARQRLVARFCGLGRQLDGESFDEDVWRRALAGMTLDELQDQTRALEVRFDRLHPPTPVSRPESLPEWGEDGRTELALRIARER